MKFILQKRMNNVLIFNANLYWNSWCFVRKSSEVVLDLVSNPSRPSLTNRPSPRGWPILPIPIDLYSAPSWPLKRWGTDHTVSNTSYTCLYLVSVHQVALPLTRLVAAIWLQQSITILIYRPRENEWWKNAELHGLVSWPIQRTVYPYKWLGLPISCRSGAGQGKFAVRDRRSTTELHR